MANQRTVVVLVIIGAFLFGGGLSVLMNQGPREADAIREALIESCERVGEPTRVALIETLREQVESSKSIPHSFFPSIPIEDFKRLVRETNARRQAHIANLENVPPCGKRF